MEIEPSFEVGKKWKKALTNGGGYDTLTKLSGRAAYMSKIGPTKKVKKK